MRLTLHAACTNAIAYPFPRLVGEKLGTFTVVCPGAVVAWDQLPAPVQVTPAISMAFGRERRDRVNRTRPGRAGKASPSGGSYRPLCLLPALKLSCKNSFHLLGNFINFLAEKHQRANKKLHLV